MARRAWICWLVVIAMVPTGLLADTLRGVVQDDQGHPIANARIDVATAAPKVGPSIYCPSCYLDCKKWARTDAEGRFEIQGLDARLKFRILSTATGKQTKMTKLIDPATETATLVLPDFPEDAPVNRVLQGAVVSLQGTPIAGALIEPYGAKTKEKRWWGTVEAQAAVSDDHGRFRMLLGDDFQGVDLTVVADGYAGTRTELLSPGHDDHEIRVPSGAAVTGQLVFEGKPVVGHQIAVVQTDRTVQNHFIKSVLAITDREGRFQFNSLPASQQYALFSAVGDADHEIDLKVKPLVLSTKTFQMPANDKSRDLGKLELRQGFTFAGRLERNDGVPVPAGTKLMFQRNPAWDLIAVVTQQDGRFAISGLPPETYEVSIQLKGVQIDSGRSNYQVMSAKSFGVRLDKSHEDLVVPLAPEVAESNATPADSAVALSTEQQAPEEESELAPSVNASGNRPRSAIQLTDEPVPENGPTVSVRGTVVTSRGERIDGATVILRAKINGEQYSTGVLHNRDILARTSSDKNGRFMLTQIPLPLRMRRSINDLIAGRGGAQIVAFAEGYAMTVADVESANDKTPLRVVLEKEVPISGIVQDEAGKGVAGALIEMYGTTKSTSKMDHMLSSHGDVSLSMSQIDRVSMTDEEGRFSIKHAPPNRRLILSCVASDFKRLGFAIDTNASRSKSTASLLKTFNSEIPVLSVYPVITLVREPSIQVRVVDRQNQPVDRGAIEVYAPKSPLTWKSISKPTGSIRVPELGGGQTSVVYASDPIDPHLGIGIRKEFKSNENIDLQLPESRWVTGRVVSLETGKPVAGAFIQLHLDAPDNEELRGFGTAISRAQGDFRVPAVPGKNRLLIMGDLAGFCDDRLMGYDVGKKGIEVDVPANGDSPDVLVKLSPGLILEGTIVNAAGEPVAGALVQANQTDRHFLSAAVRTDEDGKYRIAGLSFASATFVNAEADGIGARTLVQAPAKLSGDGFHREEIRMALKPRISCVGKVLNSGKPLAGVKMELLRTTTGPQAWQLHFATSITDAEGRYAIDGLEPGDRYEFKIGTRDHSFDPNWKHQSPYAVSIPTDATDQIELPDVNLVNVSQSLSGHVVDTEGNPVAGISVSIQMKNGMWLARRDNAPLPWTETGKDGAFQLEELPDGDLELMAHKRGEAYRTILNPVRMKPRRNQSDIRVVLDPRLFQGIEDLDATTP